MRRFLAGVSGQSTVEAALLMPVLGALIVLMVEPCCVLYTRTVMYEAAGEAVRVAATAPADELDGIVESYARRRLKAVPEVPLFHAGGAGDWQVDVARTDDGGGVEVEISGHVRPLPVAGVLFSALGETDARGVVVKASARQDVRPEWLGGDYETWIGVWG